MASDPSEPPMLAEKYQSTFQKALLRLTASLAEDDVTAHAAIHAKMRESNESIILQNADKLGPDGAAVLRDVLERVIAEHERNPYASTEREDQQSDPVPDQGVEKVRQTRNSLDQSAWSHAVFGVLLGLCIAGVVAFGLSWLGFVRLFTDAETANRTRDFETQYAQSQPKVEIAADFLARVREEIVRRQQNDGAGLAALAGKSLVRISAVLPDLAKEIPAEMPGNTALLVRADEQAYKIIFRSTLCTAVQFMRPAMLDPRRKGGSLGCEFFGVWNEQGKKF